jgi:hypothetical protein
MQGDSDYGPRTGPDGLVAHILALSAGAESLIYGPQVALTTGDPSPAGGEVLGFGPGSFGPDGVLYYTLFSRSVAGLELAAYNGRDHRILLSRGDALSDGSPPIESVIFGTTTEHVDSEGRLAFLCEFPDATSLVVGVPV